MSAERFHVSTKPDYIAECSDCPWHLTARNALGTAARHHDTTGHRVSVDVVYTVVYVTRERWARDKARHSL